MKKHFIKILEARHRDNLMRHRFLLESSQQAEVLMANRKFLNFSSNNYLGLANDSRVVTSFRAAALKYGVGAGASHMINGHSQAHHELEEQLADFTGHERALLFSTGYMANLSAIDTLTDRKDVVLQDKLNHASLIDAGRLSRANSIRYKHCDIQSLKRQLEKNSQAQKKLIATDAVFSMDGDTAPISQLATVAKQHQCILMIDDAHGFGINGNNGSGTSHSLTTCKNLQTVYMATLGKAIGTSGAFIAGDNLLIETLIQFASPYIYTTAMPAAIAAATSTSLKIVKEEEYRREILKKLIYLFKKECKMANVPLIPSVTPIQPIIVGDALSTINIGNILKERYGILVGAIRPPTVPGNTSRLRITITALHTLSNITQLIYALKETLKLTKKKRSKSYDPCNFN